MLSQQVRLACERIYRQLFEMHHQDFLSSRWGTGYLAMMVRFVIVLWTPSISTKILSLSGSSRIYSYSLAKLTTKLPRAAFTSEISSSIRSFFSKNSMIAAATIVSFYLCFPPNLPTASLSLRACLWMVQLVHVQLSILSYLWNYIRAVRISNT